MEDIRRGATTYLERAAAYFSNFDLERTRDKGKASEALWGTVSCLLNCYHLLLQGKPLSDHSTLRRFAKEILLSQPGGEELFEAFRSAEKLHANFYHMFLEDDEINKIWNNVQELAVKLESLVKMELEQKEVV